MDNIKTCNNCGGVIHGMGKDPLCDICQTIEPRLKPRPNAILITTPERPETIKDPYFALMNQKLGRVKKDGSFVDLTPKNKGHMRKQPCSGCGWPMDIYVPEDGSKMLATCVTRECKHFLRGKKYNLSSDEMYTPDFITDPARDTMGSIDLDPASCSEANKFVMAEKYYTINDNGLTKPWIGNIFLNPPYSVGMMDLFMGKLYEEIQKKNTLQAVVISNAQTAAKWFQKACIESAALCLPGKRISFIDGGTLQPKKGNDRSQAIFYFGNNIDSFKENFSDVGSVLIHHENITCPRCD